MRDVTPGKYDLRLYRGDTYAWTFRLWNDAEQTDPTDLTGATAAAQLRNKAGGDVILDLDCTVVLPNTVDVRLDAASWDLAPTLVAGQWDLEIVYPGGTVQTVVAGKVTVTADVTRAPATPALAAVRSA